jgi:hypothetical protein
VGFISEDIGVFEGKGCLVWIGERGWGHHVSAQRFSAEVIFVMQKKRIRGVTSRCGNPKITGIGRIQHSETKAYIDNFYIFSSSAFYCLLEGIFVREILGTDG